ncbi:alpha-1,2-fucosyltransferase [Patescibacteria group bacterium]|nr:MAG: alpha-1,2-fucosyltransferase [Patescibacteria group bacterium]
MIIVKIVGGLGNQMFQYAMGRRLSEQYHTNLKLDISDYTERYKLRQYSLSHLNINARIASTKEIHSHKKERYGIFQFMHRLLPNLISSYSFQRYITEKDFSFDSSMLSLEDNIYLDGYWQSEKYFFDIQNIIRREFTIKTSPDSENMSMMERIGAINAVAIHIRRGDYVTNSLTNAVHGTAPLEYYNQAANYMLRAVRNPTFVVFSDDPEWAKKNMKIPAPIIYIDHNRSNKDYEDLRLMSSCKHHIIANSSFSWWAAWLNSNPQKVVIAPKRWFADSTKNTKDLLPESWIKM